MRSPRLGAVALLAAAVLSAALLCTTACGVRVDERPRALDVPATTTTVAVTPSTGQYSKVLYFVSDGSLIPVPRDLPDRTIATQLNALLEASDKIPYGLTTSIPTGTTLLNVARSSGTVAIDLSAEFQNVIGLARQQAIGQLVLTATEIDGVDVVEFLIEGQPVTVASPVRGDTRSVTACDFAGLLPDVNAALAIEPRLPFSSISALSERTTELEDCSPASS